MSFYCFAAEHGRDLVEGVNLFPGYTAPAKMLIVKVVGVIERKSRIRKVKPEDLEVYE